MGEPVTLREVPPPLLLNLRGAGDAFSSAVAGVLGVAPPTEPNTVAGSGEVSVLWIGPDEWLVTAPASSGALVGRLDAALAGQHHSVVDVSQSRTVLDLEGAGASVALAQGVSLDLHPRAFGPGRCAQTALARVPIVLQQIDGASRFRVFVRASFAPYVTEWLRSTMADLT